MINITEGKAKKLPGKISLFVSFNYNQNIVDIFKQLSTRYYDAKNKLWEVPCTDLKFLLEKLVTYDEIKLTLLEDKKQKEKEINLVTKYKTKPFDYQLEAIKYGLQKDKWLLLDAPGLGKTLTMILLAQELKKQRDVKHCLIVCGINTLKFNWVNEIHKHSNLSCRILGQKYNKKGDIVIGSVADRLNDLKQKISEFFVITNIETLRDEKIIKEINKGKNKFDIIIVDEVHTCKSNSSEQGKNLLKLKADYKIAMTGTLLVNNPLDLYVPLKFIEDENCSFGNFKSYYINYGGPFGNEILGYKNMDVLKDQLKNVSLRRTKDILNLPPKTIINEIVEMNSKQNIFYENIVKGITSQVDKVTLTPQSILGMVCRLRQASACPSILTTENIESEKLLRAIELTNELLSNNEKVVIFSTFKETCNKLLSYLPKENCLICNGDYKDDIINRNIYEFQNNDKIKVLICTWSKMGTGITLTAASTAIFIDTPFTPAAYQQAQDRIYRIGSKKPVFIYNLICKNTIDERVLEILEDKDAISSYIIDDTITESGLKSLQKYIMELS